MPDTKSELNDIILNKKSNNLEGFKKTLLAIASFAVLLIIVVVIVSFLNTDKKDDLSKTILPPEPNSKINNEIESFKSVEVLPEENNELEQKRLESIANEIKQKATTPIKDINNRATISDPYNQLKKKVLKKKKQPKKPKKIGNWYVQVGSFVRVKPNDEVISKIKRLGLTYILYKSSVKGRAITKLLIGPYKSYKQAYQAKPKIASEIEPAAFIYQVIQ